MHLLTVRDMGGVEEPLSGFFVTRNNGEDGEKSISAVGVRTSFNQYGYDKLTNQTTLIYRDEEYIVKTSSESANSGRPSKEVTAIHRIFEDLKDRYVAEEKKGDMTLKDMVSFALKGTGYTFEVVTTGLKDKVAVDSFGWQTSYDLLRDALEQFEAEFDYSGTHILIAKEIGRKLEEPTFRFRYNINDPKNEIDTTEFKTYIRGFGKQNEDGSFAIQEEYTSPLAAYYGKKEAEPVREDSITDKVKLLEVMKKKLTDHLELSVSFSAVELQGAGFSDIRKGDYIWCIIDPLGLDVQLRAVSREDYSNPNQSAVFTFGKVKKKASSLVAGLEATRKGVAKVIDSKKGVIKSSAITKAGAATSQDLSAHTGNASIHVTSSEKTTWNNAAGKVSDLTAVDWTAPSIGNGWVTDTVAPIQFGKDVTGTTYIRGVIKNGTIGLNAPVFNLPKDKRPAYPIYFNGYAGTSGTTPYTFNAVIKANGDVCIDSSNNPSPSSFISLALQFK